LAKSSVETAALRSKFSSIIQSVFEETKTTTLRAPTAHDYELAREELAFQQQVAQAFGRQWDSCHTQESHDSESDEMCDVEAIDQSGDESSSFSSIAQSRSTGRSRTWVQANEFDSIEPVPDDERSEQKPNMEKSLAIIRPYIDLFVERLL
jgi:hypothetical protein